MSGTSHHYSIWLSSVRTPRFSFNLGRVLVAVLSFFRHAISGLSHTCLCLTPLPALAPQKAAALLFITEVAGLQERSYHMDQRLDMVTHFYLLAP